MTYGNGDDDTSTRAVSGGDVGASAVPEPSTPALLLAGLGMLGAAARRRKV